MLPIILLFSINFDYFVVIKSCWNTFWCVLMWQRVAPVHLCANKGAAVAAVAVWSAYWTTLLGISPCFWIWLRGIDRFLSRQMWFFAAPGCALPPPRRLRGAGPHMEIELHKCDHPSGNDHGLSWYVKMQHICAHFPELIPSQNLFLRLIEPETRGGIVHSKHWFSRTCWWMKRWGRCRCRRRPQPVVGLLSPKQTWSDSGACIPLFYPPLSESRPLVWSHRWLLV